jgi:hypothetical protein
VPVILVKHCTAEDLIRVRLVAPGEKGESLGNSLRRLQQSLPVGILAQQFENPAVITRDLTDDLRVPLFYLVVAV